MEPIIRKSNSARLRNSNECGQKMARGWETLLETLTGICFAKGRQSQGRPQLIRQKLRFLFFLLGVGLFPLIGSSQVIQFDPIATGLNRPVAIVHAGDGSGRLFIVQQTGEILIYDGTQVLATPFLDLSAKVECCGERGLLSLAFHPGYGTSSNFFYVYYTKKSTFEVTIARYTVSADPNIADPNSELVLKSIVHNLHPNHNGGSLQFSPIDGYLYVSIGDGGGGGDPEENGQNLNSLLGKILRLDVDAAAPYIPADNPFQNDGNANTLGEIWSYGARNPWRFTFDRLTGDILIGDVGQNCWEEVDYRPSTSNGGENYGWDVMEGRRCYDEPSGSQCNLPPTCNSAGMTSPVIVYSHSDPQLPGAQAVTGGYIYRGTAMPQFYGTYFFADYGSGQILNAIPGGSNWNYTILEATGNLVSTFGEDEAGELYYASLGFTAGSGVVYKMSVPPVVPFTDDFVDGDASDWSFPKGTWSVVNQALQGITNKKAEAFAPFAGCGLCTVEADLQIDTVGGRVSLLGWYRGKGDSIELLFMEDRDRLILKHRSGGSVGAKQKLNLAIDPGVKYHVKITFDGTQFQVFLNGGASPIITMQSAGFAAGNVGFRVKSVIHANVTGTFDQIDVY